MIDAGCGYFREEYRDFAKRMIQLNREDIHGFLTVDDLLGNTDRLTSIVKSGAKGTMELLEYMLKCVADKDTTLHDKQKEMVDAMNLYFHCNRDLRHSGRDQFAVQHAANDLVMFNFKLYMNKIYVGDYTLTGSNYCFMWSEASLKLATEDLLNL